MSASNNAHESKRPSFDSLPLRKDGPHGNAWGLFGETDQLGMLNLLTAETTLAATKEIVHGIRISTDWPLNQFQPPLFGRLAFHQEIRQLRPMIANDDVLTFNTQASTQWDGFRHCGYQDRKLYFNGHHHDDMHQTTTNGIHAWVDSGGIVGRGVLLDYHSWAEAHGISHPAFASTSIPLADLLQVAQSQNVAFRPGDILFVRSGYSNAFDAASPDEIQALLQNESAQAIGVQSSEEMLRWIWDRGFAAVAGDMPAWEAWPCQDRRFCLHEWLLAGWGLPIGELFNLETLAAECAKEKKWSFFFSSVPLNVPGGVASPANGVAIL